MDFKKLASYLQFFKESTVVQIDKTNPGRLPSISWFEERGALQKPVVYKHQVGWGCQLYALDAVLTYYHTNKEVSSKPIEPRKQRKFDTSMRKILKSEFNSSIGEINGCNTMISLVHKASHGEVNAVILEAKNEEEYNSFLTNAIDHNRPPIVFFDMDLNNGLPIIDAPHHNFHAAVLSAYYVDQNGKLKFKAMNSGKFIHDAQLLFKSSAGLPNNTSLKVTYEKRANGNKEKGWFPISQLPKDLWIMKRTSSLDPKVEKICDFKIEDGFTKKILILQPVNAIQNCIEKLKGHQEKLRVENSSRSIRKSTVLENILKELDLKDGPRAKLDYIESLKNTEEKQHITLWQELCEHRNPLSRVGTKKSTTENLLLNLIYELDLNSKIPKNQIESVSSHQARNNFQYS